MSRKQILAVIRTGINEIKNELREVSEDSYLDFRGAGLNSVELLTLIVCLEEHFEFETDDEDLTLEHFARLRDVVDLVEKKAG